MKGVNLLFQLSAQFLSSHHRFYGFSEVWKVLMS
jgi:hypothetical protein